MSSPYIGEIKVISWTYAPKGWAFCDGQLLPINQNQALFSILGTTYGGDGRVNFGLPNLQGRVPVHRGVGLTQGQIGGEQRHTLTTGELPSHTHLVSAFSSSATLSDPTGARHAAANTTNFAPPGGTPAALDPSAFGPAGAVSVQAHENMPPYLVLNFIIALQGIYPSRN